MKVTTQHGALAWVLLCAAATGLPAHAQLPPVPGAPAGDSAAPASATPSAPATGPSANPDDYRFDILEYEVQGNTVLPATAIEAAVTPFLGPRKLMADVEAARAALEKVYQQAGYLTVFVDVPEQRVDGGVIQLQVIEGRVERLMVTGSRYYSQGYIRDKVAAAGEGQVPNFNELQGQLQVVNRTEGRRVQPVLRPGKAPGTVEVEMKVEDKLPLSGSVELNNLHPADTDPLRLNMGLRYENLFQRDHALSLNFLVAPRAASQSRVLVANYLVPLDSGDSWAFTAVSSDSAVDTLGGTQVLGKGTTFGLRYVKPIFGRGGSAHSLSVGFDYKNLQQKVSVGGVTIDTPLHYLPVQLAYNGSWPGARSQTVLNGSLVASSRHLMARRIDCPGNVGPVDEFACNGQQRDRGFAALRLDARHSEVLGWGPLGSVNLRLSGQYSGTPLVSAEQFAMGGGDTVRGYLENVASGDVGWLASIELRSPNWARTLLPASAQAGSTPWLTDLTAFLFLDGAQTRLLEPGPGQRAQEDLAGTGIGLRASGRHGWNLAVDLAQPLDRTTSAPKRDPRVHVRLGMRF